MSESDSFISEVSEEVRRERFALFLRRWGWLVALAILAVVGAAAGYEWRKAGQRAAAEAAGDALAAALALPDPSARAEALAGLADAGPAGRPAVLMAEAAARIEAGDSAGADAVLARLAEDPAAPATWRDLAALRRVALLGPAMDAGQRLATLDRLAAEGAPYRPLALEQRALARLEAGDTAAALADLEAVLTDPLAPEGVAARARQLLIALGGAIPSTALPGVAPPADG